MSKIITKMRNQITLVQVKYSAKWQNMQNMRTVEEEEN